MKTHSHFVRMLIGLLIGIWMLPAATMAQETSDNMQIVREKLLADRKLFVADNMELTEAEGKAFWPVYDEFVQDLQKLGAKAKGTRFILKAQVQTRDTFAVNHAGRL